jgi:hypothetical protein
MTAITLTVLPVRRSKGLHRRRRRLSRYQALLSWLVVIWEFVGIRKSLREAFRFIDTSNATILQKKRLHESFGSKIASQDLRMVCLRALVASAQQRSASRSLLLGRFLCCSLRLVALVTVTRFNFRLCLAAPVCSEGSAYVNRLLKSTVRISLNI